MFESSLFFDETESMNQENVKTTDKVEKYDKIWENRLVMRFLTNRYLFKTHSLSLNQTFG